MSTASPSAATPDLAYGQTWPTLDVFGVLARDHRVIPVVRRLIADAETPVGVYRKLAGDRPGTFLLESAEHGGVWSRWSFVGAASSATLTERDGLAHWVGEPPVGVPTTGLATDALRGTMEALATEPIAGLPPLTGGHRRLHHLRRGAPLGARARDHARRAPAARARPDARHRPRRARPHRRLDPARRQRGQLRRHRRARRARLGGCRGAPRRDDPRPRRTRPTARSRWSTPRPSTTPWPRSGRTRPASATKRSWSSPRRTSATATSSRSFSRNASIDGLHRRPGRRLPGAACVEPQPLHVPVPPPAPGRLVVLRSSAAAPRRSCG